MKLSFYSNCVVWPAEYLDVLFHLIDQGEEITLRTFKRNTDWIDYKEYIHPFPDKPGHVDWHVSYHRLPGYRIYWFRHSAIEYVFADPGTIEKIHIELENQNDE